MLKNGKIEMSVMGGREYKHKFINVDLEFSKRTYKHNRIYFLVEKIDSLKTSDFSIYASFKIVRLDRKIDEEKSYDFFSAAVSPMYHLP